MAPPVRWNSGIGEAFRALRMWTPKQVVAAVTAATAVMLVIGTATVLIPNPLFAREIAPVWWNYPVWLVTSILAGILLATYIRPTEAKSPGDERRSGRLGMAGGFLAWFAVGCPVCNKIALLVLGYSGAITWFAPLQPVLAISALVLTAVAVVKRLRGQVACPITEPAPEAAR